MSKRFGPAWRLAYNNTRAGLDTKPGPVLRVEDEQEQAPATVLNMAQFRAKSKCHCDDSDVYDGYAECPVHGMQ